MFCSNCGAQIPDGSAFCVNCGFRLGTAQPSDYQQPAGQTYQTNPAYQQPQQPEYWQTDYQQPQQPTYGQTAYGQPAYGQTAYRQPQQYYQPVQEQGMKWHKFLVYFSLWAGAIYNFVNGIKFMTGAQYEGKKDLVYAVIPNLKAPDIFFGFICVVVGIMAAVTAVSLLKYKASGPKLLTTTYIVGVAGSLIYVIMASSVLSKYNVDLSSVYSSASVNIIVSVAMIIVNSIYYKKRAHLFVN